MSSLREFRFRGKTLDELKKLNLKEFAQLLPSRQRRSLTKGFRHQQKSLLQKLELNKKKTGVKTHCRDLVIIPQMLDRTVLLHNGKEFVPVMIQPEMLGHYLGEFVLTRQKVAHSAPGIGATKSSGSLSVR
jgi:small subunit ribosomal protein S19